MTSHGQGRTNVRYREFVCMDGSNVCSPEAVETLQGDCNNHYAIGNL